MCALTIPPGSEFAFSIKYQQFTRSDYNWDFSGAGTLTIRADGPTHVFSGRPRRFLARKMVALDLRPEDIAGVSVAGREVRFTSRVGRSAKKGKPFIFFCRDEQDAATIGRLLPDATTSPPTPAQEFIASLERVSGIRSPWQAVTTALIAANVVCFVILAAFFSAGWLEVASMDPYVNFAANNGAATTAGEWWRLVTCMFAHFGLVHLLLNMWALHQAGRFLEKLQGRWLYLLTYFGSGICGSFASIIWHGDRVWSAGASGAVFGVYGAILGHMLRQKSALPPAVFHSILKSSLAFGFYNLVYGFAHPGIDQAAHLGGAISGIALGWMLAMPLELEKRTRLLRGRLQTGLVALAAVVTVGVAVAPRFNYSIHDEVRWNEANQTFVAEETGLMERFNTALAELQRDNNDPAHAAWITSTLIPFYERWNRALDSAQFRPGLVTEQRRTMLQHAFSIRLESLRHLASGLSVNSADALARFAEEDAAFAKEIEAMAELIADG